MAFNLFSLLENEFSSDVIAHIAAFVGEAPAQTRTALTHAVPAVMCALHQQAATARGSADLFGMMQRGGFDGTAIGTPASVAGSGGGLADLVRLGGPLAASLFGPRLTGVIDWLAGASGVGQSAASSLLGLVAPFVFNLIGREAGRTGGFNAASIADTISGQGSFLGRSAPRGLAAALGVSQCGEGVPTRAAYAAATPGPIHEARTGLGWLKWLLPLLLLGLLGLLYFWWYANYQHAPTRTTTAAPVPAPAAVLVKQITCAGQELEVAQDGVETKLIAFLDDPTSAISKDTWFSFDRLGFEADSSVLTPSSRAQLRNIVEIMKCYPNLELKIGGHTDSTADAAYNLKLSQERADSTKAALVALGVVAARLAAEGYGEQFPIAGNDTEAGRQRNRRIDLSITKK